MGGGGRQVMLDIANNCVTRLDKGILSNVNNLQLYYSLKYHSDNLAVQKIPTGH